jgi:hypothetical protein
VAYFRRTTNYPLVPSSMLHSGKTSAATVTTLSFGNEIITSYVTLEDLNDVKVILTPLHLTRSSY